MRSVVSFEMFRKSRVAGWMAGATHDRQTDRREKVISKNCTKCKTANFCISHFRGAFSPLIPVVEKDKVKPTHGRSEPIKRFDSKNIECAPQR